VAVLARPAAASLDDLPSGRDRVGDLAASVEGARLQLGEIGQEMLSAGDGTVNRRSLALEGSL